MDEVALEGAEEFLDIFRARMARERGHAEELRQSVLAVMHELWPRADTVNLSTYLTTVDADLNRIPADLLNDLVRSLSARSRAWRSDEPSMSSAAYLVGNWLKVRLVEIRSANDTRTRARRLKIRHNELLHQVLHDSGPAKPERLHTRAAAAPAYVQAMRWD